jgi:hypothetical protein
MKASLLALLLVFAAFDDGFCRLTPGTDVEAAARDNEFPARPRLSAADQLHQDLDSPSCVCAAAVVPPAPAPAAPAPAAPRTLDPLYALMSLQR